MMIDDNDKEELMESYLTAQAAPVVAASELSDEQISSIYTKLFQSMPGCARTAPKPSPMVIEFARAVLAAATPAASELQKERTGYGEGVRAAAKLCDAKYAARVASGHPREASTARVLAEEIRNLQSTAQSPAVQQPAEGGTPEARLLTITGTLVELGDMKAGRGFAVETSESTYVELIGLSEQGVQDVASQFYSAVTITVRPAAPTQAEG